LGTDCHAIFTFDDSCYKCIDRIKSKITSDKQRELYVNDDFNNHTTATIQLTSTISMVSSPIHISSEFIRDSSMKDIDVSDRGFGSLHFEANSI